MYVFQQPHQSSTYLQLLRDELLVQNDGHNLDGRQPRRTQRAPVAAALLLGPRRRLHNPEDVGAELGGEAGPHGRPLHEHGQAPDGGARQLRLDGRLGGQLCILACQYSM